jgi:hypothetical protein
MGWKFIEATSHSQLLLLLWAIVAFIIPVVLATTDLRDVARRWREAGFFGSGSASASRDAFRQIYFPAWTRMAAWFVSAVVSLLLFEDRASEPVSLHRQSLTRSMKPTAGSFVNLRWATSTSKFAAMFSLTRCGLSLSR